MFRLSAILSLAALPAFADAPKVVVDIAPVHALVSQVMAGVGTPDLLLEQGSDPHSVQLRPSQARMLSDADLVVWVGPELSPWLARALDGLGADEQIVLMDHPATTLRSFVRPTATEEEHDDHAHEHDDHAHDESGHDHEDDHGEGGEEDHAHADEHGDDDPHLWTSIDNARAWLPAFAEDLAARDPENAATYRANAEQAVAGLDELAASIEARLAPHQGAEIVTFHAAWGYFAERFGFEIAGTVRPGDASTPSAAALAGLREIISEHGVECAFAEPAYDPALLNAIAGETGLRIGLLDPTGALQEIGPGHYAATLTAAADAIAGCLAQD
jgi:zinc transport system substrate-binding protein